MAKGPSKSTATIQRLLEERRQYEAWIARLSGAEDATPEQVRSKVKADYEARLQAVTEELKSHAESARQTIEVKRHQRAELHKKETQAAEKLSETELRHAVGEYDEAQWSQVHKDALAELLSVRAELQAVEGDIQKLEELDTLVRAAPRTAPSISGRNPAVTISGKNPALTTSGKNAVVHPRVPPREGQNGGQLDELAFIKSVTEDQNSAPSPKRASGANYQPAVPANTPEPSAGAVTPESNGAEAPEPRPLKCKECGMMNLPTEWYCERCGAELAAV